MHALSTRCDRAPTSPWSSGAAGRRWSRRRTPGRAPPETNGRTGYSFPGPWSCYWPLPSCLYVGAAQGWHTSAPPANGTGSNGRAAELPSTPTRPPAAANGAVAPGSPAWRQARPRGRGVVGFVRSPQRPAETAVPPRPMPPGSFGRRGECRPNRCVPRGRCRRVRSVRASAGRTAVCLAADARSGSFGDAGAGPKPLSATAAAVGFVRSPRRVLTDRGAGRPDAPWVRSVTASPGRPRRAPRLMPSGSFGRRRRAAEPLRVRLMSSGSFGDCECGPSAAETAFSNQAAARGRRGVAVRSMALRVTSTLRMRAMRARLAGLPAATRRR
jgi:hypothetical protein